MHETLSRSAWATACTVQQTATMKTLHFYAEKHEIKASLQCQCVVFNIYTVHVHAVAIVSVFTADSYLQCQLVVCNIYTVHVHAVAIVFITLLLSQDSSVVSVPDNDPWISIPDGSYTVQDEHIKVVFARWAEFPKCVLCTQYN